MFSSRLLFLFLSIYGLSAAKLNLGGNHENKGKEKSAAELLKPGTPVPAQGKSRSEGSNSDSKDIEDYVNDRDPPNELRIVVYDYDGEENSEALRVINSEVLEVMLDPDA